MSCTSFVFQSCATTPEGRPQSKAPRHYLPLHSPYLNSGSADQEQSHYQEIESLYNQGVYDDLHAKIHSFLRDYPHTSYMSSIENIRGLLFLHNKQPEQAITHFKKAIRHQKNHHEFLSYLHFNLATAEAEAQKYDQAELTLSKIPLSSLDHTTYLKASLLRATLYEKKGMPLEASQYLLTMSQNLNESILHENRKNFTKILEQSLQKIEEPSVLSKLYQDHATSFFADAVLFRLGARELMTGQTDQGQVHLSDLKTAFPQSPLIPQSDDLLKKYVKTSEVEKNTIGVLLPVNGKFAKYGARSLQGVQLALGIFGPSHQVDSKINLVVEDSGEDPEQAIQALKKLVLKHHVVAVIGPMLTKGIDQISQQAQNLGVPLLSLARRSGGNQDFVIQAGLTQQIQAYEIARYSIQQLKATRVAILYPNDKLGVETAYSFWDAVDSLGGQIVGIESYAPGETDFRRPIDKLSGLFYTESRQRELNALALEREVNKITRKTRKTEQFFRLKPIVDFDAVFIPDEAKVAGQIFPTFTYRDIEQIKFLGTSTWNSPDFLSRAQSYGESSTFVDAFFAESEVPAVKSFIETYKVTFGQEPTAMDAIAYDAGLLLKTIMNQFNNDLDREELRNQLKRVKDFQGVTGKMTYRDGQFYRDLKVVQVKGGRFVEVGHPNAQNLSIKKST